MTADLVAAWDAHVERVTSRGHGPKFTATEVREFLAREVRKQTRPPRIRWPRERDPLRAPR